MTHTALRVQVGDITQQLAAAADAATTRYEALLKAEPNPEYPRAATMFAQYQMQRLRAALAHARQLLDSVERIP